MRWFTILELCWNPGKPWSIWNLSFLILHSELRSQGLDWEDEEEQPTDHGHRTQDQVPGKPGSASSVLRSFTLILPCPAVPHWAECRLVSGSSIRHLSMGLARARSKSSKDLLRRTLSQPQCWTTLWQWSFGAALKFQVQFVLATQTTQMLLIVCWYCCYVLSSVSISWGTDHYSQEGKSDSERRRLHRRVHDLASMFLLFAAAWHEQVVDVF